MLGFGNLNTKSSYARDLFLMRDLSTAARVLDAEKGGMCRGWVLLARCIFYCLLSHTNKTLLHCLGILIGRRIASQCVVRLQLYLVCENPPSCC
jgi:hypothetical protein